MLAKKGITLGSGEALIRLSPTDGILFDSPTKLLSRGQHVWEGPGGQRFPLMELPKSVCEECLQKARKNAIGLLMRQG